MTADEVRQEVERLREAWRAPEGGVATLRLPEVVELALALAARLEAAELALRAEHALREAAERMLNIIATSDGRVSAERAAQLYLAGGAEEAER